MARRTRLNWRLAVIIIALVVGTAGVVVRLVQVQIVNHEYYAARADEEHLHRTLERAPRGAILDRNGFPLAATVEAYDVYIDPRSWQNDEIASRGASILAPLLKVDPNQLVAAARSEAGGDYLAARAVSGRVGLKIMEQAPPGVKAVNSSGRIYPEGDLASSLIGFIGRDQEGLAGIEADYDRELGGVPAEVYFERDGLGNPVAFGRHIGGDPVPGGDVHLTIDRYLQRLVEKELEEQIRAHASTGGEIIIMDPWTGQILAMASRPSFRLSKLNLENASQAELYRNRAVTDTYPPGSVIKPITAAAAIDAGLVKPTTAYFDDGAAEIEGGEVIRNWDLSARGSMSVADVLKYSLNTGAVWLAQTLGPERFYAYVKKFGFGDESHIGLGGDPPGIVRTNEEEGWYPIDLATNSFGQGINASPVQVVTAFSSLVNGGLLMRPYIVEETNGPDGHRVYEPVVVRQVISEETSRQMVEMLEGVVDGNPGHLAQVPGLSIGGKTGTTTFPGRSETIASFIGFAPVEQPRFIMLIKLDAPKDNELGGVVAAPVFAELAPHVLAYLQSAPSGALVEGPPTR
jgi:cell division protein FtsI/penicillin-binding protein 2